MAMLFSEQQPKQVHKAHLQQSMCQAMELVEHTSMGGLPQPGAFSDPQKPLKDFYKQPVCSPGVQLPIPRCVLEMGHTPGKPLLLTFPRPGSTRVAAPPPVHTGGEAQGSTHGSSTAEQLSHCATRMGQRQVDPLGQGWCWGQETSAEVFQRCLKTEGKGTLPYSPQRDSRGTWGLSWLLEDASDLQGLFSAGNGTPTPGHSHGQERHCMVPQHRNNRSISHTPAQSTPSSRYREMCVSSGGASGTSGAGGAGQKQEQLWGYLRQVPPAVPTTAPGL